MKPQNSILVLTLVTVLSGCMHPSDAFQPPPTTFDPSAALFTSSPTYPEISRSGFDNAKVVTMEPTTNNIVAQLILQHIKTQLGAQWNAARPNKVLLSLEIIDGRGSYHGIVGAELSIDGDKIALERAASSTKFEYHSVFGNTSTQVFAADLAVIDRILNSRSTWIRIHTTDDSIEDSIIENGQTDMSFPSLKLFMDEVKK